MPLPPRRRRSVTPVARGPFRCGRIEASCHESDQSFCPEGSEDRLVCRLSPRSVAVSRPSAPGLPLCTLPPVVVEERVGGRLSVENERLRLLQPRGQRRVYFGVSDIRTWRGPRRIDDANLLMKIVDKRLRDVGRVTHPDRHDPTSCNVCQAVSAARADIRDDVKAYKQGAEFVPRGSTVWPGEL